LGSYDLFFVFMASVFSCCLAFGSTIGENTTKQVHFVYGVNTPYRPRGFLVYTSGHENQLQEEAPDVWGVHHGRLRRLRQAKAEGIVRLAVNARPVASRGQRRIV
jgi:hypothetical protein